jgi:hypothetical protein
MKRVIVIINCCLFFAISNCKAQEMPYWQQQVNYIINVSLNDDLHTLNGFEKIEYINNSPDTLRFLWFHLWPNAYKNDKTAFSYQQLVNGNTDFYFSKPEEKGYINQLSFKANSKAIAFEYHPQFQDVIKLVLNEPLLPKSKIIIQTPFHVQLPKNFSRGGHIENEYQATQWYPKPAVYDAKGWHIMPYLDQGEFYSEYGNFDVTINTPKDYIVASTGILQNEEQLNALKILGKKKPEQQKNYRLEEKPKKIVKPLVSTKKTSATTQKTIVKQTPKTTKKEALVEHHYLQHNVHDFAWFASKNFLVEYDTLLLDNGVVNLFSFYPASRMNAKGSTAIAKKTLKFYSEQVGVYPYQTATIVCGVQNKFDGMEYPTITYINAANDKTDLNEVIAHELGHNWFYGVLGSNERTHPWMDEGMNTFYTNKFIQQLSKPSSKPVETNRVAKKESKSILPDDITSLIINSLQYVQKALPIDTSSEAFTTELYGLMVYEKASKWMEQLEAFLGKDQFALAMKAYYNEWKFKHPTPLDFKNSIEKFTGKNIDVLFAQLKNSNPPATVKKAIKPALILNLNETNKYQYLSFLPTASYNLYDGVRVGAAVHNYQLPLPKLQFFVNPSFGLASSNFNLFARGSLNKYTKKYWLQAHLGAQHYTYDNFTSDAGKQFQMSVTRFTPGLKITFYNDDIKSKARTQIGLKMFYLTEQNLNFTTITTPTGTIDNITTPSTTSYVNRLYLSKWDDRVLYPYHMNLTIDQSTDFVRAAFTAKQYFNYANNKGGIEARFFAGKFFYLGTKTFIKQFETDRYHLNLSGPKGYEDYTYSDYFVGRSEFEGWQSQQIMERDGFFKVRTDLLGSKIGKTDDWLMALNLSGDLPESINPLSKLPLPIKLKFYIDIGTYAEAWKDNPATGRFLYNAGLQLPIFKEAINVYFPILMSKVFSDYNQSILGDNSFSKTISFTINMGKLRLNKLAPAIPL